METREEGFLEMNGHLRLTHEQRALATKMPGCAAWVWFELLAWHGKPVSRGRLLDASGADSLRSVERALAYLSSVGLAVSGGDTWAARNGQKCDTKRTILATPARQQVTTDGDNTDDTMVTKLSLENQNQVVIHEIPELPKETNDIKETKKQIELKSSSVLPISDFGAKTIAAEEILKLEMQAKPALAMLEGKERYWLGQLSDSVEGRLVTFKLLANGVEVFRSLLEFQNLTNAPPATLRAWAKSTALHLEKHGLEPVLEAMRITLSEPLEKKSKAWTFFERVLISPRIEKTPFVPLAQQINQIQTQSVEAEISPFSLLLKQLEETP